ncbi:MAG: hypothetical protein ACYTEX_02325 [Planctomycetota bacterium]|jgi:hypothetical protein
MKRTNNKLISVKVEKSILLTMCILLFSLPVFGNYEISWSTIDAGGGISSGDDFVLTGTIGQADAAYSTGEIFELYGGFWPGQLASCWDARVCAGQPHGDATCEGTVNLGDLFALKAYFGKCAPWTAPECCADFTHDGCINLADLFVLKAGFGGWGYSPSTSNQRCPP